MIGILLFGILLRRQKSKYIHSSYMISKKKYFKHITNTLIEKNESYKYLQYNIHRPWFLRLSKLQQQQVIVTFLAGVNIFSKSKRKVILYAFDAIWKNVLYMFDRFLILEQVSNQEYLYSLPGYVWTKLIALSYNWCRCKIT